MTSSPPALWRALLLIVLAIALGAESRAQPSVSTFAQGLTAPIGIEIDSQGRLWVAQQGTARNDSRISVVTTDGQVHSFLEGLPSGRNAAGEITGTNHPYFDGNGNLVIVQGEGADPLSASVLLVDTTGFVPGNSPLGMEAVHTAHDIGSFSLGQGFAESNPYTLVYGPNDDLFIVDAAANAIIHQESNTSSLDVFATFADIANNSGIGPPTVNAVPTGIVFTGSRFYVGSLTGFPFSNGAASVYEVDLSGNVSVFRGGLTTVVDVDVDPRDDELVVLQHAAFTPPPPFLPNTGGVFKLLRDGGVDTLALGLNRPSGMRFSPNGDLYISTLTEGEILKLTATPTGVEEAPERPGVLVRSYNYPNPFHSETRISYELAAPRRIIITVVNVLGQEVRLLLDALVEPGRREVVWDGRDDAGRRVVRGVYFYRISGPRGAVAKKMVLLD